MVSNYRDDGRAYCTHAGIVERVVFIATLVFVLPAAKVCVDEVRLCEEGRERGEENRTCECSKDHTLLQN